MYYSSFNLKQHALHQMQKLQFRSVIRKLLQPWKNLSLCSFTQLRNEIKSRDQIDRGIQTIPVDKVVGTAGNNKNFDDHFNPRTYASTERWVRLYIGFVEGSAIPPVDAYKFGDKYYIEDGHHRISVARAIGQISIEAHVIEIQ